MHRQQTLVRAVAEIAINVNEIGRMREFYETVLGFEFFAQHPDENPTIMFLKIADLGTPLGRGGHPQLFVLIDVHRHPGAIQRFEGIDVVQSTFNHVAFEIAPENFDTEQQRLERHGLAPHTEQFVFLNARALFFEDPEGNLIEFICHHKAD